eukprot:349836-Chlamydomonas_euryale.AAC.3
MSACLEKSGGFVNREGPAPTEVGLAPARERDSLQQKWGWYQPEGGIRSNRNGGGTKQGAGFAPTEVGVVPTRERDSLQQDILLEWILHSCGPLPARGVAVLDCHVARTAARR